MITVGDRIKEAIDYMDKGQIEHALTAACIALDITAQKVANSSTSKKSDYKRFLSDYMWLITYMGLPGMLASTIRIPFVHKDIKNDTSGCCGIEDVIYHVIRCGFLHSTGSDSKITWSEHIILGVEDITGNLIISKKFIWGLVGSIIFCPVNKDEKIGENYWISLDTFKFFITEVWGRVDLAQRVIRVNSGLL